jgi:hypothetical protein
MACSSIQRSRPPGVVSNAGRLTVWMLRLAFSLVLSAALLSTASASSSEREREGERGEFGEFGEGTSKLATETSQDGESSENDSAPVCAGRRNFSSCRPRARTHAGYRVPRALTPTVHRRTIQRSRHVRRAAPVDDDEEPLG